MGGPCVCRRGQDRKDQNGLEPIGGSAIGTSLGTGHYYRVDDFGDCCTPTDLYSTANQHTKTHLYSSPSLTHTYPATSGYAQADSHANSHSHAHANTYPYPGADFHTNSDPNPPANTNSDPSPPARPKPECLRTAVG